MPMDRLTGVLDGLVARMEEAGTAKGAEVVVREVIPPRDGHGPRFLLEGQGDKAFIRMNANSYLGLSLHPEVIEAEEATARAMGAGPGAGPLHRRNPHAAHTAGAGPRRVSRQARGDDLLFGLSRRSSAPWSP